MGGFEGNIISNDFSLDVSKGKYPEITSIFKFGAGNVTTSETILWEGADGYNGFLTTATVLDVKSTSTDDVYGTGIGAWNMVIYGLGSDFNEIIEVINLNGTAIVSTTQSFIRVYRALIVVGGTAARLPINGANQGTINIFISGGTTVPDDLMAQISPNKGQTLMCIYTVPAGKTLYVTGISGGVGQGKEATLSYKARNSADSVGAFSTKYDLKIYEASVVQTLTTPLAIPEKTDIVITGIAGGVVDCTASFGGILVNS